MPRIPSGRPCAVCGQVCDFDVVRVQVGIEPGGEDFTYGWRINVSPLQTEPRALYFQGVEDFCGARCSLDWYEKRRATA